MTLAQIQADGTEALLERLGAVGMIRFLQQFEAGSGDYTKERERWLEGPDQPDVDALADQIGQWRATQTATSKTP